MSRRITAAMGAIAVALAASAAVAQNPGGGWISAVSGKAKVASPVQPTPVKSDRIVKEQAKPAPKVESVATSTQPARAIEPAEKEATTPSPIHARVGKKTTPVAKTPHIRRAEPQKRLQVSGPVEKIEHSAQVAQITETAPKPSAKLAAPSYNRGDRPDMMVAVAREENLAKSAKSEKQSVTAMALSMIAKLAVVLALAYLTVRVIKWFSDRKDAVPSVRRDMKIVDTIKLSNTNSVHMISVKGKTILVGCSSGQVSLLGEFEGEEVPEIQESGDNRFADYLLKYSGGSAEKTPAGRMAGLLRDCSTYLRTRGLDGRTGEEALDEA